MHRFMDRDICLTMCFQYWHDFDIRWKEVNNDHTASSIVSNTVTSGSTSGKSEQYCNVW